MVLCFSTRQPIGSAPRDSACSHAASPSVVELLFSTFFSLLPQLPPFQSSELFHPAQLDPHVKHHPLLRRRRRHLPRRPRLLLCLRIEQRLPVLPSGSIHRIHHLDETHQHLCTHRMGSRTTTTAQEPSGEEEAGKGCRVPGQKGREGLQERCRCPS